MPFRTIDLCAGIGGIRRGFELTGEFVNVAAAEIDRYALKTYAHLFNEREEDVYNDVTSDEFKAKLDHIKYDVLSAGFPCQTFSRAGLEEGFNNKEKGVIFNHIAEIIERTRPRAVFLENVDNLVRHDKGRTFRIIIETLELILNYKVVGVRYDNNELQYKAKDFIRNSRYFGIPQNRPRVYIIAFDRERYGEAVQKIKDDLLPEKGDEILYGDLRDLLERQADAHYYMASGYLATLEKHKERERRKGNGFGYRIVNDPSIEHPVANTLLATGGSGKERNLVYDPQDGIAGRMVKYKKTPLNDKGIRFMTPSEWGKLQGFINYAFVDKLGVDRFSFPSGITPFQQYKQFGNAVTITVIKTMAEYMLSCFRKLGDSPDE